MPCRVEFSDAEIRANQQAASDRAVAEAIKPFVERNDALTHENDFLRELILKHAADVMPLDILGEIEKTQTVHRLEDLRRLDKTIRDEMWELIQKLGQEALGTEQMRNLQGIMFKIQNADPTQPLAEQLGFDPDSY